MGDARLASVSMVPVVVLQFKTDRWATLDQEYLYLAISSRAMPANVASRQNREGLGIARAPRKLSLFTAAS